MRARKFICKNFEHVIDLTGGAKRRQKGKAYRVKKLLVQLSLTLCLDGVKLQLSRACLKLENGCVIATGCYIRREAWGVRTVCAIEFQPLPPDPGPRIDTRKHYSGRKVSPARNGD